MEWSSVQAVPVEVAGNLNDNKLSAGGMRHQHSEGLPWKAISGLNMHLQALEFEEPKFIAYSEEFDRVDVQDDCVAFFPEHPHLREAAEGALEFSGVAPTVVLIETNVWPTSRKTDLEMIVARKCPELNGLRDGHCITFEKSESELVVDFLHFAMGSVFAFLVLSADNRRVLAISGDEFIASSVQEDDVEGIGAWDRLKAKLRQLNKTRHEFQIFKKPNGFNQTQDRSVNLE